MNTTFAIVAGSFGIVVSLITIVSALAKVMNTISGLRSQIDRLEALLRQETDHIRAEFRASASKLEHENDKLLLTVNGARERTEHINTRIANQYQQIEAAVEDVEGWLQKNTAYERRKRRRE